MYFLLSFQFFGDQYEYNQSLHGQLHRKMPELLYNLLESACRHI